MGENAFLLFAHNAEVNFVLWTKKLGVATWPNVVFVFVQRSHICQVWFLFLTDLATKFLQEKLETSLPEGARFF